MTQDFAAQEAITLFPTAVWRSDLKQDDFVPLNNALMTALAAMGAPKGGLRPGENWQSDHDLHRRAPFQPLMAVVQGAARAMLDYLHIPQPLIVTGCWANFNPPGTGHRVHSHRNNFLSGSYYAQVQEGADTIVFFDPRPQAGAIRPHTEQPTAENSEVAMIRIQPGSLILFPSWLQHSVDANRSGRMRVSVSFNLMFPGFAEEMARPAWHPGKGNAR